MTSRPEKFWIDKDDLHGIFISTDSKKDIAIQACVFIETHRQGPDGKIERTGIAPQVINQVVITTTKKDGSNDVVRDPVDFKKLVNEAISQMRKFITVEKRRYEMTQGVLADYWPTSHKHNQ